MTKGSLKKHRSLSPISAFFTYLSSVLHLLTAGKEEGDTKPLLPPGTWMQLKHVQVAEQKPHEEGGEGR